MPCCWGRWAGECLRTAKGGGDDTFHGPSLGKKLEARSVDGPQNMLEYLCVLSIS